MMRSTTSKCTALFLSLLLLLSAVPLYASAEEMTEQTAPDLSGLTTFTFDGNSVTVTEGSDTQYEIVVYDATDTESAPASETDEQGHTVYSVPEESSGQLLVSIKKKGGSYVFQGSGNGSIAVKKEATGDSILYLNGLKLTSAFTAVLTVKKDSTAACTIYAIGENTLTDNAYNNEDNTDNVAAENAVIKCKDGSDVTITGSGTLNVIGLAKNGVKANNLLTIEGGITLRVEAPDNGISSENAILIHSGTLDITTEEGDGIKAASDTEEVGEITIDGGDISIDAGADGIQATCSLTVSDGTLDITTYNGYDDPEYNKDNDAFSSAKGLKAGGSYLPDSATEEVDATNCDLTISGGTITVNSADDALHSDNRLTITGGVLSLMSGDDGIHADYILTVGIEGADDSAIEVSVSKAYEGIEAAQVVLYSGTFHLYTTDDCINAANGDLARYDFQLDIYGGYYYAASETGDCADSNGDLNIYGGTVILLGSLSNGEANAALDSDGAINLSGGQILAVGQKEMAEAPSAGQPYVTWTSAGTSTAVTPGSSGGSRPFTTASLTAAAGPGGFGDGSFGPGGNFPGGESGFIRNGFVVTVSDADGNTLISVTTTWDSSLTHSVGYVLYSGESLTAGSSYTLTVSEEPEEEEETILSGDLDGDGLITVSDVVLLRQIILTGEWSDRELTAGDLDISGGLTVSDVVALRALILSQ
ncbi:MAG: carbohydrate-binding domain-containing protein [Candidatus Howiella sp.]